MQSQIAMLETQRQQLWARVEDSLQTESDLLALCTEIKQIEGDIEAAIKDAPCEHVVADERARRAAEAVKTESDQLDQEYSRVSYGLDQLRAVEKELNNRPPPNRAAFLERRNHPEMPSPQEYQRAAVKARHAELVAEYGTVEHVEQLKARYEAEQRLREIRGLLTASHLVLENPQPYIPVTVNEQRFVEACGHSGNYEPIRKLKQEHWEKQQQEARQDLESERDALEQKLANPDAVFVEPALLPPPAFDPDPYRTVR